MHGESIIPPWDKLVFVLEPCNFISVLLHRIYKNNEIKKGIKALLYVLTGSQTQN